MHVQGGLFITVSATVLTVQDLNFHYKHLYNNLYLIKQLTPTTQQLVILAQLNNVHFVNNYDIILTQPLVVFWFICLSVCVALPIALAIMIAIDPTCTADLKR